MKGPLVRAARIVWHWSNKPEVFSKLRQIGLVFVTESSRHIHFMEKVCTDRSWFFDFGLCGDPSGPQCPRRVSVRPGPAAAGRWSGTPSRHRCCLDTWLPAARLDAELIFETPRCLNFQFSRPPRRWVIFTALKDRETSKHHARSPKMRIEAPPAPAPPVQCADDNAAVNAAFAQSPPDDVADMCGVAGPASPSLSSTQTQT